MDNLETTAQFLKDNGIFLDEQYDLDHYIGSGSFALVYKVKNKEKVLKIYRKDTGYDFNKYNLLKNKGFNNVVKVYYNKELSIPNVTDPVAITVLELLHETNLPKSISLSIVMSHLEDEYHRNHPDYSEGINELNKKIVDFFKEDHDPKRFYGGYEVGDGLVALKETIKNYKNNKELLYLLLYCYFHYSINNYGSVTEKIKVLESIADNRDMFEDILNGIKEFETIGDRHDDIHIGNILYSKKDKNYKLIDPI